MNDYLMKYEDALFKAAIHEAAKEKSVALMNEVSQFEEKKPSEIEIKRFEKLLDKKIKHDRSRAFGNGARRIASRVVIAIMVIVTISFTVTMSVEALRSRFVSFLMTFTPRYTELQLQEHDENGNVIEGGQSLGLSYKFAPSYLPKGFVIKSISVTEGETDIYYADAEERYINFMAYSGTAVSQIDMENADIIKTIDIGENSGLLAEKDGLITIAWSCDDYYFVLLSRVGESETTKIAESVKIQK